MSSGPETYSQSNIPLDHHDLQEIFSLILSFVCTIDQSVPSVSERLGHDAAVSAGAVHPAATVRQAAEGPGAAAATEVMVSKPQAQPAAQKPTVAEVTPEKSLSGEPTTVKPCSAEPDREKLCFSDNVFLFLRPKKGCAQLRKAQWLLSQCWSRLHCRSRHRGAEQPPENTRHNTSAGGWGDMEMVDEPKYQQKGKSKVEQIAAVLRAREAGQDVFLDMLQST
ncbi:hypothetical protein Q7C36_005162 [Tachysurus vachellii]|uniref:Uncharacterized protein n=1 Tax=Tachysurus vachellii TaxID=175792 RepID=A0AA88NLN4_TACVA|nr:hypothetical protein Q7C36_005162 [Tachysurus vachellii]